jgi:methyl-accepting chemotaxis protein
MIISLQSIRSKIIATTVASTTLLLIVGIFSISSVHRPNGNIKADYSESTLPILYLENIRAAQLDMRLRLRRIQASRSTEVTNSSTEKLKIDMGTIAKAWADYYPVHVNDGKERAVADQIRDGLDNFQAVMERTTVAAAAKNYDAVEINRIRTFIQDMQASST